MNEPTNLSQPCLPAPQPRQADTHPLYSHSFGSAQSSLQSCSLEWVPITPELWVNGNKHAPISVLAGSCSGPEVARILISALPFVVQILSQQPPHQSPHSFQSFHLQGVGWVLYRGAKD